MYGEFRKHCSPPLMLNAMCAFIYFSGHIRPPPLHVYLTESRGRGGVVDETVLFVPRSRERLRRDGRTCWLAAWAANQCVKPWRHIHRCSRVRLLSKLKRLPQLECSWHPDNCSRTVDVVSGGVYCHFISGWFHRCPLHAFSTISWRD